jgi:hypothetical protein
MCFPENLFSGIFGFLSRIGPLDLMEVLLFISGVFSVSPVASKNQIHTPNSTVFFDKKSINPFLEGFFSVFKAFFSVFSV